MLYVKSQPCKLVNRFLATSVSLLPLTFLYWLLIRRPVIMTFIFLLKVMDTLLTKVQKASQEKNDVSSRNWTKLDRKSCIRSHLAQY